MKLLIDIDMRGHTPEQKGSLECALIISKIADDLRFSGWPAAYPVTVYDGFGKPCGKLEVVE